MNVIEMPLAIIVPRHSFGKLRLDIGFEFPEGAAQTLDGRTWLLTSGHKLCHPGSYIAGEAKFIVIGLSIGKILVLILTNSISVVSFPLAIFLVPFVFDPIPIILAVSAVSLSSAFLISLFVVVSPFFNRKFAALFPLFFGKLDTFLWHTQLSGSFRKMCFTTMMNEYLADFEAMLKARFADDRTSMSYSEWICRNTKLRKKPFSFKKYPFQKAIVDDFHPNLTVVKPSQVGLTEIQLRKFAAFLTRENGVNGIMSLPDDQMYRRVAQTRFLPMINENEVFNLGTDKPVRSVGICQINQSFGFLTGGKEGDATSINADLLFHDELDLSDQEMIALYQSRLQGSSYKITQSFSTPTYEGFGVDAQFSVSDQHEYLHRCSGCGHHNIPEFTDRFIHLPGLKVDLESLLELDEELLETINLAEAAVVCERCRTPLDYSDPNLREWVARFPSRRNRGYRVSPFATDQITLTYMLDQLVRYKQKDALRRYVNTVLGQPYEDSNSRLTEAEILASMGSETKPDFGSDRDIWVGIDVGQTCHITLLKPTPRGLVAFGWKQVLADNIVAEVQSLSEEWNIIGGLMDRNPYTPTANEVRDTTGGKIVPIEYATTPKAAALTLVKDELGELSHIVANRTHVIDATVKLVRKRQVEIVDYGRHRQLLITHMRDMVREERPEDDVAIWKKTTGTDHWMHSFGYANFASRVFEAIRYREDFVGQMAATPFTISMKGPKDINMKNRMREDISLGSLF